MLERTKNENDIKTDNNHSNNDNIVGVVYFMHDILIIINIVIIIVIIYHIIYQNIHAKYNRTYICIYVQGIWENIVINTYACYFWVNERDLVCAYPCNNVWLYVHIWNYINFPMIFSFYTDTKAKDHRVVWQWSNGVGWGGPFSTLNKNKYQKPK